MPLRVAILEMTAASRSATGDRGRAIQRFLREKGCDVDILAPSADRVADFSRFRFSFWSRLKRRVLSRSTLPHLWDYVATEMETRIRRGRYDVIIGRDAAVAYVLAGRGIPGLKVYDLANVAFLELYYSGAADAAEVEGWYVRETKLYRAVDYILSPHEIFTRFFRERVLDDDKVVTVRLGCNPAKRRASFSRQPRLVYAGSYQYIQDPYLLALLTSRSPFPIDCFGTRDPNRSFLPARLNYLGYRDHVDFMADYQVGLVTVAADRLRRYSPATKFAYYFAHGLPVLFPEWMQEGHTYPAAVPYTEEDFPARVTELVADEHRWRALSDRAAADGEALTWDKVLSPLAGLLGLERVAGPASSAVAASSANG